MYCKFVIRACGISFFIVLIVAKCIVNKFKPAEATDVVGVLIVAKCIVNTYALRESIVEIIVLIVAKCIVN